MASDDENERLGDFVEYEVLSELSDQENIYTVEEEDECEEIDGKRLRIEEGELSEHEEKDQQELKKIKVVEGGISNERLSMALRSSSSLSSIVLKAEVEAALSPSKRIDIVMHNNKNNGRVSTESRQLSRRIETNIFSQIPPELLFHILKFLSSEDLVSCSLVCRFLNFAAADESLWRRLVIKKIWQHLSRIARPNSKRSQAPHPSQVNDDRITLDQTLADQISMWKSSRGLPDMVVVNHA